MFLSRLLTVVLLLSAARACAGADDPPHPIAAQVKAALKDPAKPFVLLVHLKVKEGSAAKFEAAFARAVKPTRAEKGCVAYELSRDVKTPTQFLVYERWQNLAALDAHLKSAHIKTLLTDIGDLLDGAPESRVLLPAAD